MLVGTNEANTFEMITGLDNLKIALMHFGTNSYVLLYLMPRHALGKMEENGLKKISLKFNQVKLNYFYRVSPK